VKRTRTALTICLPAALIGALALTGCTGGDSSGQDCAPEGKVSKSIKIEGDFGAEVTLASETPVTTESLERTVAIKGDGDAIKKGETVVAHFTVINAKTGDVIAPGASSNIANDPEVVAPWAAQSIACSSIGDRVVTVVPSSDVLGEGGGANYDLEDSDSLIAVFDFEKVAKMRAWGTPVDAPKGFPTVELAENGAPTITIPEGAKAPTKLDSATILEGDGATVSETDTVTVQYAGVVWSNGKEFDSSWANGAPYTLPVNQFVPGFTKSLVGQKVGSQVIAIIPPKDGYGDGTADKLAAADATEDDVMVFVVDILDAQPAAK